MSRLRHRTAIGCTSTVCGRADSRTNAFHYDYWDKNIAPSAPLLVDGFMPTSAARWPEFQRRYAAELSSNPDSASLYESHYVTSDVTWLLYFLSLTELHNNAVVVVRQAISGTNIEILKDFTVAIIIFVWTLILFLHPIDGFCNFANCCEYIFLS